MLIDMHVHVSEKREVMMNNLPKKLGPEDVLSQMQESGVTHSVLLNIALKGIESTKKQNTWLSELCKKYEGFSGFGSVHPNDGVEALEEMERCVCKLGLKGFKLHPNTQGFDSGDENFLAVLKKAGELNVPVIVDSYSPFDVHQPAKLLSAILKVPETKICLAHVGLYRFMEFGVYGFFNQYSGFDLNVYFDLSASCTIFSGTPVQDQFRWITEQVGSHRLLFGSDFPMVSQKKAIEAIKAFGYNEDWLENILYRNAARLLNFEE